MIRIVLIILILIIRGLISDYISDYIIVCSDHIPLGVVTVVGISAKLINCGFTIDSPGSFLRDDLPRLDCLPSMQCFDLKRVRATPSSLISVVEDEKAVFAVRTLSFQLFSPLVVQQSRLVVDRWNVNFIPIDNGWISESLIGRQATSWTLQRAVFYWEEVDSIQIRVSDTCETASCN